MVRFLIKISLPSFNNSKQQNMKKNKNTMNVYFKFDLPCDEIKMIGKHPLYSRYYLLGYMDYTLSNVEFLEGRVFFELRDEQGLIGKYMVLIDNWERIVEIEKGLVTSLKI